MKNYHDCKKYDLGWSDISMITAVGVGENGIKSEYIYYGSDGDYSAYLADEETAIPDYYEKTADFENWATFYSDYYAALSIKAEKIEVYRAGDFGTIIKCKGLKRIVKNISQPTLEIEKY